MYCIGFLRVEIELNNQKERLFALENVAERTKPPFSDQHIVKIIKDVRGMYFNFSFDSASKKIVFFSQRT